MKTRIEVSEQRTCHHRNDEDTNRGVGAKNTCHHRPDEDMNRSVGAKNLSSSSG
ncbi:hypothetical protein [Bacillus sinesaloumensis]|uniref:hypothetical protein n=1 Tax=Litchfieldia sinesaloumensis TaxID=1926280 RepID=UPI0013563789|nr:hypothetical protein [Bacillus sinesaloumensis]